MSKLTLTFVLLSFVLTDVFSQNEYSLKQAQEYALKNNYQAKLADKGIEASHQTVKSYTAIGLPQVYASGDFQNFINIPTSVVPADAFGFPTWFNQWIQDVATTTGAVPNVPTGTGEEFQKLQFGSKYTANGGLAINQLLFDGSYFIGLKAARTYVDVASASKEKTESEIRNLVAQAYYMVVIADENIKLLNENKTNVEQTLKETAALHESGFVEIMAVEQLQLMAATITNSLNTTINQKKVAEYLLKFQMGIPANQSIALTDNLESLVGSSENLLDSKNFNSENHADFKLATTQLKLMNLNYKVEKSKQYPRLTGFFNHQYNSFRNDFDYFSGGDWFPTTLWGLKLQVPVFTSFMNRANIQKAKIEMEKSELQQAMIAESLSLQFETSKTEYYAALEQMKTQQQSVELAKRIKVKTDIKFKEGIVSSMELNQAQTQLLTAQGSYIQSIFTLLNAKSTLNKALGN